MTARWRRTLVLAVIAFGVMATEWLLYRADVRDEMTFLGAAALVLLYGWVFLWR